MRSLLKNNRYFLVPYAVFLLAAAIMMLVYPKPDLHILSNRLSCPFGDVFFKYATHLGDGMVIALLAVALLFVRYRYAIIFLMGSLSTALIINLLKRVVMGTVYRPAKYFELYQDYQLHFVDGVKLHYMNSFPSGHTGTAFNVFFFMALIAPKNGQKLAFFFMALLVGYSRVYLSQHFMIDITVGSLIGTGMMALAWVWVNNWKAPWLNQSILKR